ncbi:MULTISPECIES: hypothetical protein [Paenibacillus]|nr:MULTISPECIES: hypothetical protein [Paenibacillus]
MNIGESYFLIKDNYHFLKPGMVDYAESELCKKSADQASLDIRV